MFKIVCRLACLALAIGLTASALAATPDSAEQAVRQKLATLLPGHAPDAIKATPVAGLYQVRYGMQVFYVTADGRYLLKGDLVDLNTKTDLTRIAQTKARKEVLGSLPADTLLTYRPEGKVKHVIYVFSDIDCPYCQRLHADLPTLNGYGVEVRYLFFPRSGLGTPSALKAESVWCAKNRDQAYNRAMEGEQVPSATCSNPVARDYNLGLQMGVQGTPTIVLSNGEVLPGYLPPQQLLQAISQAQSVDTAS
jgi:thiol:disulfide interchange protein DsbC